MNRRGFFFIDFGLLAPALILAIFGLATLFSISIALFVTQFIYIVIGLLMFFIFCHFNYKVLHTYAAPIYIFSIIVLVFVLILGLETRGAVRWIEIFGLNIQFSEILKPMLLISFASFLSKSKKTFKRFFLTFVFLFPIGFLIYAQPDLGNALIYAAVTVVTMFVYGFPILWFIIGSTGLIVLAPLFWQFLRDYQKQRILTFFHPTSDPLGTSYNAIQAIIAVGSGMFFGKGLGQATQSSLRFLPERHTDFIFATLTESFGFVGGVFIIVVFIFLLYRIFVLYESSEDAFRKIFSVGAFLLLVFQFFLNIGMNIGITPIVGVTLPFVSYGGSSAIASFILLGILSSFSANLKNKDVLEIR